MIVFHHWKVLKNSQTVRRVRFLEVLGSSSRFFGVLRGSSRFFEVLRGSSRFFEVLRGSSRFLSSQKAKKKVDTK
jgi:hypothetical protein